MRSKSPAPTTARGLSTRPGWKIFWKAPDVSDYESLQYFQRQLMDSGVIDRLVEMGVQENDTIRIGEFEFDYVF